MINKYRFVGLMALLLLAVIAGGCGQQATTDPGSAEASTSIEALQPVGPSPYPVATAENAPAELPATTAVSAPETAVSPTMPPSPPEPVQILLNGITFTYDPTLFTTVESETAPWGGADQLPIGQRLPEGVQFAFFSPFAHADEVPLLTVTPVRYANGLFFEPVPSDIRAQVDQLDQQIAAGSLGGNPFETQEQQVQFVNGRGFRTLARAERDGMAMTTYTFQGLSNDRRFWVQFAFTWPAETAVSQARPTLLELDQFINTLFIDVNEPLLNATPCEDDAEFVSSQSIPDGTEIAPGATFTKTWRMRNIGSCTWTSAYSWTFTGGDALKRVDASPIDLVLPGEEIDVSVTLIAPEAPGTYAAQWKLTGVSQFTGFGDEVYFVITVP